MQKFQVSSKKALAVVGTLIVSNLTWAGITFKNYVNAPDIRSDVAQYEVAVESIRRLPGSDKVWVRESLLDAKKHLTEVNANLAKAREVCDSDPEADCRKTLDMGIRRVETVEKRLADLADLTEKTDRHVTDIIDEAQRTMEAGKPESVRNFLGWQLGAQIVAMIALFFVPPIFIRLKREEDKILDTQGSEEKA